MNLLALKQAEANERTSLNNFNSVKTANKIAYIGLTIAILSFGYNVIKDIFFSENPTKSLQSIQQSIDTIHKPVFSAVSKYLNENDNAHKNLHQMKVLEDSLKNTP
jgi:hypothetical protein